MSDGGRTSKISGARSDGSQTNWPTSAGTVDVLVVLVVVDVVVEEVVLVVVEVLLVVLVLVVGGIVELVVVVVEAGIVELVVVVPDAGATPPRPTA